MDLLGLQVSFKHLIKWISLPDHFPSALLQTVYTHPDAGKELVGQLLENPRWSKVVTVSRRAPDVSDHAAQQAKKMEALVVNMDKLEEEAAGAFEGADSVFCALGTTRDAAGSADAFRKVDLDYVAAAARASKTAGVPHFALVSAQGAWSGMPSSDLKIFHGLLYSKTKGLVRASLLSSFFIAFNCVVVPTTINIFKAASQWLFPHLL